MSSFFTQDELKNIGFKSVGENVSISRFARIYVPENISIGDNVRIDDFCFLLSGGDGWIVIGSYVHIAVASIIVGTGGVEISDFAGLSSRVAIYSATDDYTGEWMTNPTVPSEYTGVVKGKVILEKHVIIGTGSTILPDLTIGEGCSVGANSLVKGSLAPWGIYVGNPAKRIRERSKRLLELEKELMKQCD